MRGKQAKILSNDNLEDLLLFAETNRHPLRNKLIVLLSAKAGLRAGEIARLTWAMVTYRTEMLGYAKQLGLKTYGKIPGQDLADAVLVFASTTVYSISVVAWLWFAEVPVKASALEVLPATGVPPELGKR